jgi:hypothetical protein
MYMFSSFSLVVPEFVEMVSSVFSNLAELVWSLGCGLHTHSIVSFSFPCTLFYIIVVCKLPLTHTFLCIGCPSCAYGTVGTLPLALIVLSRTISCSTTVEPTLIARECWKSAQHDHLITLFSMGVILFECNCLSSALDTTNTYVPLDS